MSSFGEVNVMRWNLMIILVAACSGCDGGQAGPDLSFVLDLSTPDAAISCFQQTCGQCPATEICMAGAWVPTCVRPCSSNTNCDPGFSCVDLVFGPLSPVCITQTTLTPCGPNPPCGIGARGDIGNPNNHNPYCKDANILAEWYCSLVNGGEWTLTFCANGCEMPDAGGFAHCK
jgi:hypothetical protein